MVRVISYTIEITADLSIISTHDLSSSMQHGKTYPSNYNRISNNKTNPFNIMEYLTKSWSFVSVKGLISTSYTITNLNPTDWLAAIFNIRRRRGWGGG